MNQLVSLIDQAAGTPSGVGSGSPDPESPTNSMRVSATNSSVAGRVDLPRVTASVRHMVGSLEPSRTFSDLAQVCVPAIADACTIDLVEQGGHRYRLRRPGENLSSGAGFDDRELVAEADFASDGAGGPRFSGVLVCTWFDGYRPSESDVALLALLVDHTTAMVEHERLLARVGELQACPENAALSLPGHQRVAAAVGILMALHHLSAAQATDLLTRASQHTHLSIRGVADTVLRTGAMPDHRHPVAAFR